MCHMDQEGEWKKLVAHTTYLWLVLIYVVGLIK